MIVTSERVEYGCNLTSCDNIVQDVHLLAWFDRILLHLEVIRSVFLLEAFRLAPSWELSLLANGHERSAVLIGDGWREQEASALQSDDDVGFLWVILVDIVGDIVEKEL